MREEKHNPHNICTWRGASDCEGCDIHGLVKCRHNWSDLLAFVLLSFTGFLPAGIGMYNAGYGWWLLGWIGFALFFFNLWETKILCSHCPFYATEGITLACIANHGCLKPWKYNPAPMSRFEKIQFLFAALVLTGTPFPFLIMGKQWLMLALALVGMSAWILNLRRNVCSRCINFSCPVNLVPKHVVDAYLVHNPVMMDAWISKGYRIN